MSIYRRNRRMNQKQVTKHLAKLSDLLGEFYTFLEQSPKPTDEEVRAKFVKLESRWKGYCKANELSDQASLMFNREVSEAWHNRYAPKKEDPEN